jgi:ABC-type nitrate/sulfonate/bicarbonate transport system permease component
MIKKLFKLRGELDNRANLVLTIFGIGFILLIWFILTMGVNPIMKPSILPSPIRVFTAFGDLYQDNEIIRNTCLSIGLNMAGYVEAILISLPVGFIIGLFPFFKGSFHRPVDSFRYVPLTALTGLFIVWFGIGTPMKVHFLAFGIVIYLLPIIVQRIREVNDVYLKTVYTLGASDWETIRTVYWPSVISRLSDDIRVLTAISWTYIIVAENMGSQGGIGSLIWKVGMRQGRVDKVFAMLLIIMLFGILQDRIFIRLDRYFFPHKYQIKDQYKKGLIEETNLFDAILEFATASLTWLLMGVYIVLFINEFMPILGDTRILSYLFGDTVPVIHLLMWTLIIYRTTKFISTARGKKLNVPKTAT